MKNWYVLAVWTGKELQTVEDIKKYNETNSIKDYLPFVPKKET